MAWPEVSFITAMSLLAVSAQFETRQRQPFSWRFGGGALGFFAAQLPSLASLWVMPSLLFGYVLAATSILGNLNHGVRLDAGSLLLLPVLDTTQVFVLLLMAGKTPQ